MTTQDTALIYCEGAFRTTNGKTAHGLVRRSRRYRVAGVIDSSCAGEDAGQLLDGKSAEIPIYDSFGAALAGAEARGLSVSHLIIGLAPDGGRLPDHARRCAIVAISRHLSVISGLHDYLSEDDEIMRLARAHEVDVVDVRKPPAVKDLHHFSGEIGSVSCRKVALLGTDSAVGKRTTAWMMVDGLEARGVRAQMVGTGQTAQLQGAEYGIVLDSIVNDFVAGEIEHAVVRCFREKSPDVIVVEGQGSLMNPAYPGGFEILAAARPDVVVLQHAPARKEYDGFPGFPLHPIADQIRAIELISGRPVVAIAVNEERLSGEAVDEACEALRRETGRRVCAPLRHGVRELLDAVLNDQSAPLEARDGGA